MKKDLCITEKDVKNGVYQGNTIDYHGNVSIGSDLGEIYFESLRVYGFLSGCKGSGIKVNKNVWVGGSISIHKNMSIGGKISVSKSVSVGENISIGKIISIGGSMWIGGKVWVKDRIWVYKNITVEETITVEGSTEDKFNITCKKLIRGKIIKGNLLEH